MNTRSFAEKFARSAPKHKILKGDKTALTRPQVGYYDTLDAFNKNCSKRVVNAVKMDKELPRDDKMLTGNNRSSLMKSKVENEKRSSATLRRASDRVDSLGGEVLAKRDGSSRV